MAKMRCILSSLNIFMAGCGFLNVANGHQSQPQPQLPPPAGFMYGQRDIPASFDYVIVGGGTAGLTLAARLSLNNTVAVIEAGGFPDVDNGIFSSIPAVLLQYVGKEPLIQNPLVDWEQRTTPQSGFGGATPLYAKGKTLGGDSSRHSMYWHRASKGAFKKWADEVGDQSYTFENMLQFFKKSVQFTPPKDELRGFNVKNLTDGNTYSESGGPLQVSYSNYVNSIGIYHQRAFEEIGFKQLAGMVDGSLLGYTFTQQTIDPVLQERSSPVTAFLPLAFGNGPKFSLYTGTLAKQILFDANNTAIGVTIQTGSLFSSSVTYNIFGTKEVILCAGAFRSPQLLMVSGVGPSATLKSHGIKVIADRPGVGQNLADHVWTGVTWETDLLSLQSISDPAFLAATLGQYATTRTGLLTNNGNDIIAFEKLPLRLLSNSTRRDLDKTYGHDWPDVEFLSANTFIGNMDSLIEIPTPLKNYTAMGVTIAAPFSRGNVTIASNNTMDNPIVNPGWLTDPRDQEIGVAMIKRAREILGTHAMRSVLKGKEVKPGEEIQTDGQILAYLKRHASSEFHAAGSNKMGKKDDPMAVVDSNARVMGVQNLRIVDASIFPLLPAGHPQSTVYALAEKIAAHVLDRGS